MNAEKELFPIARPEWWTKLHDLWTKAVGTPGYNKREWEALEAKIEQMDFQMKEFFKRGREWELQEWRNHLKNHKPKMPGICTWCKEEEQS